LKYDIAHAAEMEVRCKGNGLSRLIVAAIAALFLLQMILVFTKSINWDEFLHYSQVYDLPRGRVVWATQTLHARLFAWAPWVSHDVITQLEVARLGMLAFEAVAVWMIVLMSRQLVDRQSAFLTGLVYLAGGYVFLHGFSFRPDPMITATLMVSLYLIARRDLTARTILLCGVLIGVAGVMSIKSVMYFPCFAGVAWYRVAERKRGAAQTIARIAAIPVVAALIFYLTMTLHRQGIATTQDVAVKGFGVSANAYLLSELFHGARYTVTQALVAPVITVGTLILPFAWRRHSKAEKVMLVGLLAPLVTLIFYRNTFPYFFVFLLAPVCVAISPSIAMIARRYGASNLLPIVLATPAVLLAIQPYGVLPRQHALIGEIHRLFPQPTGYLAYTGFVPDYPRIIPGLISGVGLTYYYRMGKPIIANSIERGDVGFVLSDTDAVSAGLEGRTVPGSLQPRDFAALHGNFIPYVSDLWIAGKMLCPASGAQSLEIYRPGIYSLEGGTVTIDRTPVRDGSSIILTAGRHNLKYKAGPCLKLWALPQVPHPARPFSDGPLMTMF
jgi:hypothetical protein